MERIRVQENTVETASLLGDIACSPRGSALILRGTAAAITCLALWGGNDKAAPDTLDRETSISDQVINTIESTHNAAKKPELSSIQSIVTREFAENATSTVTKSPEEVNDEALDAMRTAEEIIDSKYQSWQSEDQISSLIRLWWRESRWDAAAENPDSGACGIPQANPQSHDIPEGFNDTENQIEWGLDYIADRYQSPAAAWVHSEQHGWY